MNIEGRIQRAEKDLSIGQEPVVCEIVHFAGPLPAEERHGNVTVRHVAFESVRERLEKAGKR